MFEEDQETLAAEYVLGTLSAEEREHAEALRSFDPEFDAAVKQWERRLGELNVMVEAVEPPKEVWDKIKSEITGETPADAEPEAAADTEAVPDLESPATVDTIDFLFDESATTQPGAAAGEAAETPADDTTAPPPLVAEHAVGAERGADVVQLRKRVGRWRGFTIAFGAIAALLAAYIAVSKVAPDLIPPQLRAAGANLMARTEPQERGPSDRLIAVLQQTPIAPAFLLTVDTQERTVVVRRVSAGQADRWADRSSAVHWQGGGLAAGVTAADHAEDVNLTPLEALWSGLSRPSRFGACDWEIGRECPAHGRVRKGGYRMAGSLPLMAVGWPALTSGAVPRSTSRTLAKMPTAATMVAHRRPTTMIFKWVRRSALYIEWFMATSRFRGFSPAPGQKL
jgi:anti-sigma-K factor RskA